MRVSVAKVDDNENEYSDKNFNIDIEQLDISEQKFDEIKNNIKNYYIDCDNANFIIQFGTVYIRIYNLIGYLKKKFVSKEDALRILSLIKAEIQYSLNEIYEYYRKKFLFHVDEKSNLHKIDKLEECIDDLYVLVNNQKVDK